LEDAAVIKSVWGENFLPFRKRVELPLENQGFVLVRGRNLVSAAADANGVGKTSVAHLISYNWFGEDLDGRKADAVACRFTDGPCVTHSEMEDDFSPWTITRGRRPATLKTTGIKGVLENEDSAVLQQKIEQRLGFGVRTFKNAVVFGQGAFDRFANADQAEAMRMLDEIQGVDFRDALGRAKAWRDDLRQKMDDLSSEHSQALIKRAAAEKSVTDLTGLRNSFEADKRGRLAALWVTEANAQRVLRDAEDAELIGSQILEAVEDLRAKSTAVEKAKTLVESCRAVETINRDAELRAVDAAKDLEARLDALFDAGSCPTCRQSVKQRKTVRKLFTPELERVNTAALQAIDTARLSTDAFNAAKARHASAVVDFEELAPVGGRGAAPYLAQLESWLSPAAKAQRVKAVVTARANADAVRRATLAEEATVWDGSAALATASATVRANAEVERLATEKLKRIEVAEKMAEYWVEAFGDRGIRSMLADGVAEFVNDRVAAHLEELAAGEATMKMSMQTELKKGGARERISFTPEWSWGGSGAGTGSGGQDRRMDLALFAAVQDLAESRSARPFPLKVWDEPGDALDARGQELFCQWVARQARVRGTGLLITHSQQIADGVTPDHVWTVVMDRGGARVEIE
jgi:hypothetical protein